MNNVQPADISASDMTSDCWIDSFRKHTESSVLNMIDNAQVEERRNWFPMRSATVLNTVPMSKLMKPVIHVNEQNTFLFCCCAESSCSAFTCAYFIMTSPSEVKKLPNDANTRHRVVPASSKLGLSPSVALRTVVI